MATTGERVDPFRGYNFVIQIDNTTVAGFREVSGLTSNRDPVEYREGTDPVWMRKLTGITKFANIMLSRGFTSDLQLFGWYANILSGHTDRRNGAVILRDEDGAPKLRWNFTNGWICKYEGATLNASTNDVALEKIEICVEYVTLVPAGAQ